VLKSVRIGVEQLYRLPRRPEVIVCILSGVPSTADQLQIVQKLTTEVLGVDVFVTVGFNRLPADWAQTRVFTNLMGERVVLTDLRDDDFSNGKGVMNLTLHLDQAGLLQREADVVATVRGRRAMPQSAG